MNRAEAEQIATAVSVIRPDWLRTSLVTALGRLPEHYRIRPARDVHLALLWLAYDPDTKTPGRLGQEGPWWGVGSLAGPGTTRTAEPGIVTYCTHGEPGARCLECHPRTHQGTPPTPEQRAVMRAAIAAAKAATKGRETR